MLQRIALLFCLFFSAQLWAAGEININTASAVELQQLRGVGETKAERIVQYREKHGEFLSVDQLTDVRGIGSATLEKNRALITVEDIEASSAEVEAE